MFSRCFAGFGALDAPTKTESSARNDVGESGIVKELAALYDAQDGGEPGGDARGGYESGVDGWAVYVDITHPEALARKELVDFFQRSECLGVGVQALNALYTLQGVVSGCAGDLLGLVLFDFLFLVGLIRGDLVLVA